MDATGSFKNVRMVDLLVEYGYVSEEQIRNALKYQKENNGIRLGKALVDLDYLTEAQMLKILAVRCHLNQVDMAEISIDPEAVAKIPPEISKRYQVLGVKIKGDTLVMLTNDPLDFYALEDVRQITGMELEILLCESEALEKAIYYYCSDLQARQAVVRANDSRKAELEELRVEEGEDDTPIINLLNRLIQRAYHNQASDIHMEPFEDKTMIRMRIDGVMVDFMTLQKSLHSTVVARIKILSDLDIAERRLPQDGHFRMKIDEEELNMRISVLPTLFGEKVVIRLLADNMEIYQAERMGMEAEDYGKLMDMLRSPNGMIYLTGPTGSGKTTTLYMILRKLSSRPVNICTIEDPVERNIPRLNQCQVNKQAGMTFERGLRAILRQDPDMIMVGETRDKETASISVRAAITGHLVFSTLHTNDAVSAIVRLNDMGLESYLIANSLVGVVAQRLMRKICPDCAVEEEADEETSAYLGVDSCKVKRAVGCSRCRNTGYQGRFAIHEILVVDRQIRTMIVDGASVEEIKSYAVEKQGMRTLRQAGTEKVLSGMTTVDELYRVAYYE